MGYLDKFPHLGDECPDHWPDELKDTYIRDVIHICDAHYTPQEWVRGSHCSLGDKYKEELREQGGFKRIEVTNCWTRGTYFVEPDGSHTKGKPPPPELKPIPFKFDD